MAKTSKILVNVEPDLKEQAEKILVKLGLQLSSAVNLFLRQVVLRQCIPFDIDLPIPHQSDHNDTTGEQPDISLTQGMEDFREGRSSSADKVVNRLMSDIKQSDYSIVHEGMKYLVEKLGIVEAERFITAIKRDDCDYTEWRQRYFSEAYKDGPGTQLANFLNSAAMHFPQPSFGLTPSQTDQ